MPDLLATHRALLDQWRGSMNLVGPGDPTEHYQDSERAVGWLSPTGRWADLGTGAGFPGVVFAARFPEVEVHLVDSRRKRCVFLREALGRAEVGPERVRVLEQRVEDLPSATYDGILARAFAPPAELLAHAARLLVPGGVVVVFLQEDAEVPGAPGFEVFHVEHYRVTGRERKAVALRWSGGA